MSRAAAAIAVMIRFIFETPLKGHLRNSPQRLAEPQSRSRTRVKCHETWAAAGQSRGKREFLPNLYTLVGGPCACAGSLEAALLAYARCTSRAGHATRPHRAWQVAQIALESGCSADAAEEFLAVTLPDGFRDLEQHVRVLIADARREDVEPAAVLDLLEPSRSGPDRARVHLALARTYRRQGRPTAAALELERARALLDTWPGWLHDQVEQEAALVQQPVLATPAQHRVLALTAEGHSNRDIADTLELSERTVAVHIAAMLRANGVASRTALAARHLRARLSSTAPSRW